MESTATETVIDTPTGLAWNLKPCPFCGGPAELEGVNRFWVACHDCHAEMRTQDSRHAAISEWNRREYPLNADQPANDQEPERFDGLS